MSPSMSETGSKRRRKPNAEVLLEALPAESSVEVVRHTLHLNRPLHESRHQMIADAAYRRAEARGFAPEHELDDWLAAEAEVDARISAERAT